VIVAIIASYFTYAQWRSQNKERPALQSGSISKPEEGSRTKKADSPALETNGSPNPDLISNETGTGTESACKAQKSYVSECTGEENMEE